MSKREPFPVTPEPALPDKVTSWDAKNALIRLAQLDKEIWLLKQYINDILAELDKREAKKTKKDNAE